MERLVKEKRLYIGPWYILQDEWLTGSESNLRNLETGMREAKGYGNVSRVGYFPDSFGNMGQAPQILLDAGIDCAAFGRGVKPTGFNNEVSDGADFASRYSEMRRRLLWEVFMLLSVVRNIAVYSVRLTVSRLLVICQPILLFVVG